VVPFVDWTDQPPAIESGDIHWRTLFSGEAFGRIYRSTKVMVNIFEPYASLRDRAALSPHIHDDFEQGSGPRAPPRLIYMSLPIWQ
jgi:hypothetical protein